jgi:hypothetical protein
MSALRRFQPLGIRFSGFVLTAWHSEQVQAGALTVVDTYFLTYRYLPSSAGGYGKQDPEYVIEDCVRSRKHNFDLAR